MKMMGLPAEGAFLGRVRSPRGAHPMIVTVRNGNVVDITVKHAPTVSDICEMSDPADYVCSAPGKLVGTLEDIASNSFEATRDPSRPFFLSPVDLQAVKASGVTFVSSLLERVIEEQARGAAEKADAIRRDISNSIGKDLSKLKPGSREAMDIKTKLISLGAWSQYLEVGIGPDAEIFTKCQPLSSVGFGADIGLHPISTWNNPEPEIAIVVSSAGRIVGATLGNDVNLRDVEGRSALLLGKAKDNNASCAVGPFIRLFDESFSLEDIRQMEVHMTIDGEDGFHLHAVSSLSRISRDPGELVAQMIGPHHRYPDGAVLFLGTMFAPTEDRDVPGMGFSHKVGDNVRIRSNKLGALANRMRYTNECDPWDFGAAQLMRNLAKRRLI